MKVITDQMQMIVKGISEFLLIENVLERKREKRAKTYNSKLMLVFFFFSGASNNLKIIFKIVFSFSFNQFYEAIK